MDTFVSSSRWGLLLRAAFRGVPSTCLFAAVGAIWRDLDFSRSATSSLLVEYSYLAVLVPLAAAALWLGVAAAWYGLMALWPAHVGVEAGDDALALRLGPWGTRRYDAPRLDLRYLFELEEEDHGGSFEAFVPAARQRATALPPLKHPASQEPLRQIVLRVLAREEPEVARRLRPAIDRWRALHRPELDAAGDEDEE